MENIFLNAKDGYKLNLHIYETDRSKAIVQIIHGMEEHQERYNDFARRLNQHGFSVVSSDMRGHGQRADTLGYFKDTKGYAALIKDQKRITAFIQKRYPALPIYIFAHSMGTIITRVLLQKNSLNYAKVILSGYPNYHKDVYLGILLAQIIQTACGPKYKSKLINKLSVGAFNKQICNPKTDADWISYNEQNVQAFIADPYCGIGFTCSAFQDLFRLVALMHQTKRYQNVNQKLRILLLSGKDDPCVGGEAGIKDSRRVLLEAGFHIDNQITYPHMRHEILFEAECQKVHQDILTFLKKD